MLCKNYDLEALFPSLPQAPAEQKPRLYSFLHEPNPNIGYGERQTWPVMVVVPGGGYGGTSDREADPIAVQYFAAGYHAFTLRYSCAPCRYPLSLLQLMATILYIRQNAAELHADPERIFIVGFSAGGHLCASAGTLWKEPVVAETLGVDPWLCRPTGMILSYPVITGGPKAHRGSFINLLGEDASDEQIAAMSIENRVDADTCPAFIWHTFNDAVVPIENSLYMALALREADVPCEMHIYPDGPHGLALCNHHTWNEYEPALKNPHAEGWFELSVKWLHTFDKE